MFCPSFQASHDLGFYLISAFRLTAQFRRSNVLLVSKGRYLREIAMNTNQQLTAMVNNAIASGDIAVLGAVRYAAQKQLVANLENLELAATLRSVIAKLTRAIDQM
jgi:hypothetical protein